MMRNHLDFTIVDGPPPAKEIKGAFAAIDTEYFQIPQRKMHRPQFGEFGCATVCLSSNPNTVYIVDTARAMPKLLLSLAKAKLWVMQNAAFDLPRLREFAPIDPRPLWDTLLIERILYSGFYDGFGLADMARRYLGLKMDKSIRDEFGESHPPLTDEQRFYACQDAAATLQIQAHQAPHMSSSDVLLWETVDQPAFWATLDFAPVPINVDKWLALAEENRAGAEKIRQRLGFNPNSYKVAKERLMLAGLRTITSTGEKVLRDALFTNRHTPKVAKLVEDILTYREQFKAATTYGVKFVDNFVELDAKGRKVFVPRFDTIGARSGRMASSDPNGQNIKKGKHRDCIEAPAGEVLIVADVGQQEPRIEAYLTQDPELKRIFKTGQDIYLGVAQRSEGVRKIEHDDPRRQTYKAVVLGLGFGLTNYGLAQNLSIDEDKAAQIIDRFFAQFSGVKLWINEQRQSKPEFSHTVMGRKFYLNHYNRRWLNQVLNQPIQGTAADITKLALAKLHQRWQKVPATWGPFPVCLVVHDELVLRVPKKPAKLIAKLLHTCMTEAMTETLPDIPSVVEVMTGLNWGCKKGGTQLMFDNPIDDEGGDD